VTADWLAEAYGVTDAVTVTQPPVSVTSNKVRYGDVAALLAGELPPPPSPSVLRRSDGQHLFYIAQVNLVFGEAESGKTWVAIGAIAEALRAGKRAAFIDIDHNGMQSIVTRLMSFGVPTETLANLERFRYKEPEDKLDLVHTVADLKAWRPHLVTVDSVGELLPMMGLNSNSPDDFTIAHSAALKPLAMSGACVIAIDHVAKNAESKAAGPTGTAAKGRAVGGVMLRVTVKDQFAPGNGGSCYLNIKKDRHGGLRASSPAGDKEPLAGTFKMFPDSTFAVFAPQQGERTPDAAPGVDLAELQAMDPEPENVRDVMERLKWGSSRATVALRVYRNQLLPVTETQGRVTGTQSATRSGAVPEERVTSQQLELGGEAA
jgi:hypothetical protein